MQELTYPKYFIFWLDINSPPNKRIEANTKKELIKKLCLFLSYDSDEIFNIQKKSDTGICGYNTDGGWAFCGGRIFTNVS